jgi:SAM-dependent methyltransferase
MRKARCPVSFFPADNDAWVRIQDVEAVAACAKQAKVYPIEGAMHEVRENQEAAEKTMRLLVSVCREQCFPGSFTPEEARVPDKKAVFAQNKLERDRLRRARPVKEQEDAFWGKYLEKYRVMEKMDDYQQYLDLVGELLGRFGDGEVLLDAGCGNGLLGVWVVRELLQRQATKFEVPPLYFGMDLTDSGLSDALGKHAATKLGVAALPVRQPGAVDLLYSRVDLDLFGSKEVPVEEIVHIADDCFDKIVCSLLLSYLKSPERLLKQLHRVIRPGGRIVISSMKPFCDLSSIYRDFVDQKASNHDVESARELLRAAGAIKVKQEQGYYAFFSAEELAELLIKAGFKKPQCFTSLGNQACVAFATK